MSVPLYWNTKGLPIGTQFLGPFGDEATLFRLAAQLETESPWKDRRPPSFDDFRKVGLTDAFYSQNQVTLTLCGEGENYH